MGNVRFIGQSVDYVGGYGSDGTIESAARTCTQTESNPTKAEGFVRRLVQRGHMSPTEFGFADFLIECDRAIQQELTRHRHLSFNVESTRLVNYTKKPLRFVTKPPKDMEVPQAAIELLEDLCEVCATTYETLMVMGAPRDYARKALPLALASRMRVAGDARAWAEVIDKRSVKAAHPEIREVVARVREALGSRFAGLIGGSHGSDD